MRLYNSSGTVAINGLILLPKQSRGTPSSGLLINAAPLPAAMDAKYPMFFRVFMNAAPKAGTGR